MRLPSKTGAAHLSFTPFLSNKIKSYLQRDYDMASFANTYTHGLKVN